MAISDFRTNPTAVVEGVWVNFSANKDKTIPGFKLARMSRTNRNYLKVLDAETKHLRRSIELDTISPDKSEEVSLTVFVKSILLDWRNVQPDDDGKNVDFNEENAAKLLGSPEWEDLYTELQLKAKSAASYRDEALKADAKN